MGDAYTDPSDPLYKGERYGQFQKVVNEIYEIKKSMPETHEEYSGRQFYQQYMDAAWELATACRARDVTIFDEKEYQEDARLIPKLAAVYSIWYEGVRDLFKDNNPQLHQSIEDLNKQISHLCADDILAGIRQAARNLKLYLPDNNTGQAR